jgi:hypothetical protein
MSHAFFRWASGRFHPISECSEKLLVPSEHSGLSPQLTSPAHPHQRLTYLQPQVVYALVGLL